MHCAYSPGSLCEWGPVSWLKGWFEYLVGLHAVMWFLIEIYKACWAWVLRSVILYSQDGSR